ncbi:hypothetical protein D3C73_1147860 [compost metagenome]
MLAGLLQRQLVAGGQQACQHFRQRLVQIDNGAGDQVRFRCVQRIHHPVRLALQWAGQMRDQWPHHLHAHRIHQAALHRFHPGFRVFQCTGHAGARCVEHRHAHGGDGGLGDRVHLLFDNPAQRRADRPCIAARADGERKLLTGGPAQQLPQFLVQRRVGRRTHARAEAGIAGEHDAAPRCLRTLEIGLKEIAEVLRDPHRDFAHLRFTH